MKDKRIIIEKAKYYLSKDLDVHITLDNGFFYNGKILEINDERIILLDIKVGEVYISLFEVNSIEPFREREVKK